MWFRRHSPDREIDKEIRYHFDRMVREYIAAGIDDAEARRRARLEFGGLEQVAEEVRDARGRWFADFAQDLRYAARTLRRSPAFLAVSVLSLALGIGANSAIFSLVDALMLRPLPVPHPGQLVSPTRLTTGGAPSTVSYPYFERMRDRLKTVSAVAVEMESTPEILLGGVDENLNAELVSGSFFQVMGIPPAIGRLLNVADDVPYPAVPVAVIGYDYWQRRFGGSPSVVGKTFSLEFLHRLVTIVGVTPRGFGGALLDYSPDLTMPLAMMNTNAHWHDPKNNFLNILARLKPGETIPHANAELQSLWAPFREEVAATLPERDRPPYLLRRAEVLPAAHGISYVRQDYSAALLVLMGIVGLVLLLACANLSGMLLARAAAREREISIRLAIGAGSGRLMRQFLTESLVLAAIGGGAGLLLARWFSRTLLAVMAGSVRLTISTAPDWQVLSFTAGLSLTACLLAGLAPGWHALRADLNPGLKKRSGNPALGKALVASQIALSMVLVVGAVLFTRTLAQLNRVDRGLRTSGILTFRLRSSDGYSRSRQWQGLGTLEDALNQYPGVASASVAQTIPIGGGVWDRPVQVEGQAVSSGDGEVAAFNAIGVNYFATVRIPLVLGREFDRRDTATSAPVAIVNETFARHFFPGESPLGRRVKSLATTFEIVGVVRDSRNLDLRHDPEMAMFIPWQQFNDGRPIVYGFLVRVSAGDPGALAPVLPELVRQADPGFRIRALQTYDDLIGDTIVTERIMAALGGFFGLLALLVACLGVFGVMAFQVSRRTSEIGLRMALGAGRGGIVALVLREAVLMVVVGCIVGAGAALTLTGLTRKMLFGVTPNDPAVFLVAAALLAVAALAAAWLPARRAARIDPLTTLRQD
jgi:putative ABC transport system permease protein